MKIYFKFLSLFLFVFFLGLNDAAAQTKSGAPENKAKIRLGLSAVKTGAIGEGVSAPDFAAAIQNTLVEYLKGTKIEIVLLEAKLPSLVPAEAKEKNCDFLLYVTASHKKGGGGFGKMFGAVAPVLGQVVPMAGMGGNVAGAIAGQAAAQAAIGAASMSSSVKSKDAIQLDVMIYNTDANNSIFAKTYKAKAKSDGEDIISPLIEQTAQDVVDAATGKSAKPPVKQ